jgi:hypothetical protein
VLYPYLLGGIARGRLHHDVKLPRLWHGVDSLVVYLVHMISLSPSSILTMCWQDRCSTI